MTLHDFKEKRKMRVYILIAFFIFTLFLTFCFTGLAYDAPTWNIQTIDTNTRVASYCPIAVDSNNYPHIAYANKDFGIMYSSWNGSAWNTQKVIEGKGRTVSSLVLDADNNPHILHDGLTYTVWTESGWTTRTVYGETADSGTLALDSSGNPHIAYTTDKVVKYARWTGSEWNIQKLGTSQSEDAVRLSLVINSNNTCYLIYGSLKDVKLVIYCNSSWTVQTVASDMHSLGNIVLDSKGYPHFIYAHDYSESGHPDIAIIYASWNGIDWNIQKAVSNVTMGGLGSRSGFFTNGYLSLDSHDIPHIAYVTDFTSLPFGWGIMNYASWTGANWNIQNVNSTVNAQSCYLTLDSNNNPHMSFHGVVQDSEAVMLVGPYSYVSPVMYATIPEFPSWTPLLSTLVAVVTVSMIYRRRLHNQNQRGEK